VWLPLADAAMGFFPVFLFDPVFSPGLVLSPPLGLSPLPVSLHQCSLEDFFLKNRAPVSNGPSPVVTSLFEASDYLLSLLEGEGIVLIASVDRRIFFLVIPPSPGRLPLLILPIFSFIQGVQLLWTFRNRCLPRPHPLNHYSPPLPSLVPPAALLPLLPLLCPRHHLPILPSSPFCLLALRRFPPPFWVIFFSPKLPYF